MYARERQKFLVQNRTRLNAMLSPILARNRKCEQSAVQTICLKKRKYNNRRERQPVRIAFYALHAFGSVSRLLYATCGSTREIACESTDWSAKLAYVSLASYVLYTFSVSNIFSSKINALFITDLLAAHKKIRVFSLWIVDRSDIHIYVYSYTLFLYAALLSWYRYKKERDYHSIHLNTIEGGRGDVQTGFK